LTQVINRKDWPVPIRTAVLSFFFACAATAASPVQPAADVDIALMMGKWYEIARVENEFQIACRGTTATYSLVAPNTLDVSNSCWVGEGTQEKHRIATGRAWINSDAQAKWKVSFVHFFFWWKPFASDYWLVQTGPLDESGVYSYAVLGHPRRKFGWILSRKPNLDEAVYTQLSHQLKEMGYDLRLFRRTDQSMNL
jgi:apolipoprotein D and lipocalin family protein